MKAKSARDANSHFGESIDAADRDPVVVTQNDCPVADAADTVLPEFSLDKAPGYDGWLFDKVSKTLGRVESGEAKAYRHDNPMPRLHERLKARLGRRTA